ncbi:unnamed protein product [Mytilus coruscus]|uniref:CCHC-type domain-containing protein n=1 Tax=Mytilus coruscus TaxID=42192 RepID=A0A6J8E1H4_MYTCO|nr:unnamed protein product [Mytilus coruscus]
MIETQREIQRLTKEYETLQEEMSSAPTSRRSPIPSVFQLFGNHSSPKRMKIEKPVVPPSKYDGSVSWEDYKIQFEMISELNSWTDKQKAMFLATSLSGNTQTHPKTLDDAVKLTVELEAFYIADKQRDKPSSVRNCAISESSEVSGQIKTLTDVVEELRRELQFLKRDMSQQRRGFNNNNNKTGKRGCWTCGETSHIRRNCPNDDKNNRNYQQKDRVRTGRVAIGDGGMYIPGKFQGTNVQCLVDTGANVTILNDKVYDSLSDGNKVVLRPTHTNMKLADDKPLKVRGIGKMNVEIGRTLLTHDVWVADIDEDIDCIIGFDFMKQNMCCVDVANNTMTVNKEEISCAVLNTHSVRCCRVAVSETTAIPPGVEQIIPGKVIDIGNAPECSISGLKPYYGDFDNWLIKTVIQNDTKSNATAIEENNIESDIELSENEQCDMSNFQTDNIEYGRGHRVKRPPNRFVPDYNLF